MRSIRKKQRFFLLIEVLIALWIASMCLFALIKPHMAIRKADIAYVENLELERCANLAYFDLKISLMEKRSPNFEDFRNGCSFDLDQKYEIQKHSYGCCCDLKKVGGVKKNSTKTHYLNIRADLYLYKDEKDLNDTKPFTYHFIVAHKET